MDVSVFIEFVRPLLSQYGVLISFLGGFFAGEEVIMTLAFLAANGLISIWTVFVFCFIGIILCDLFFFFIGRIRIIRNLKKYKKITHVSKKMDKFVTKLSRGSPFLALFYTKFIFGTRIATLIYLGYKRISLKRFLLSDIGVGLLWMSIVVSLGWFAGSSFNLILDLFKNVQIALLFLIIFAVIIIAVQKWIAKKLMQKQKQLN